jgi:hypothetical protein
MELLGSVLLVAPFAALVLLLWPRRRPAPVRPPDEAAVAAPGVELPAP